MPHVRAAAFALVVVLAGGPVLAAICESGCSPRGEGPAAAPGASCHATAPEAAGGTTVGGLTSGGCDHGLPEQAIRPSGSPSGAFHKAVIASVVSRGSASAASCGPAADSRAPSPPKSVDTGFALPLRI